MSALGLLTEEKTRKMHGRRVSEETVYSVHSSSNGFSSGQRGLAVNGTGSFLPRRNLRPDTIAFKTGNSYVAQRVLSAKVLRFKELQNELQEIKNQLHEVMNENKLLRNLQKRQDTALSRYEDSSAALPRLLENHRAEVNTLKAHAREVRAAARSLHRKLQRSENELLNLRDEHEKLLKIAEDKDLEGRSQLQKRIEELEDRLNEMKEKNIALSRKMEIEQKSHSQQMSTEIAKRKALSKELQTAINEVSRLTFIIEHQKMNINSGGDNESSMNLIFGNSKLLYKKPVSQRNPICSKKHTGNIKPTKLTDTQNKNDEANEKDKDELNQDFHIPLQNKSSNESLDLNSALAQNIVNGLDLTTNEFIQTDKKKTTDDKDFSSNKTGVKNSKIKKNESEDENRKEQPARLSSSNGENYSWYSEAYSDKSKNDFSTTPSRTSCDVNESKSSAQSDRHEQSYIPKNIQNESSDSTEEEEKIKLKIKKERYRTMINRKSQNSAVSSRDNDVETTESSNNENRKSSSRYKSTKNNLNKIQDHLNKFDEGVDNYLEEKSVRNKNSSYGDTTEKGVKKHGNFNDYIKKLEEIDRLNDSLIATSQNQDHCEKNNSDDDDGFYVKGYSEQDSKETDISLENRKFRKNMNEIDLKEIESDKFLEEIDTSYKMIRSRMDSENEIMNQKLQEYCKEVAGDMRATNDAIDRQKQNLERNKRETEMIERAMRTNSKITEQLKFGGRIDSSKKTQLLAALKAIDCGKDIDDLQKPTSSSATTDLIEPSSTSLNSSRRMNKKQIMKELFD